MYKCVFSTLPVYSCVSTHWVIGNFVMFNLFIIVDLEPAGFCMLLFQDINRQIVKSEHALVKIPCVELEIPPKKGCK